MTPRKSRDVQAAIPPARPTFVPHITAWSLEHPQARGLVAGPDGLAYTDESPEDRDPDGALWTNWSQCRYRGTPRFAIVHPQRQRTAMQELLCQVCAQPADVDSRGVLWLLEDNRDDFPHWPEELLTTHPPVCLPCTQEAIESCPHLNKGFVAVRVKRSQIFGVYGSIHARSPGALLGRATPMAVGYEQTERIRWVLARQLVRVLHACTLVDPITGRP
jgi:hypothetical protein